MHGKYYGTGKRKTAIARIFLSPGRGVVTVNGRTADDYFPRETLRMVIQQPFEVVSKPGEFDVVANVCGGGIAAQAQAMRHGVTRALPPVVLD